MRYRQLKFSEKKGFPPKWGWPEPFFEIFFKELGPHCDWKFYEVGHFFQPPLSFSANRKNVNFAKIKNDRSVFSDISWPLTSFIFFFCAAFWNRLIALMKLFSLGRTDLAVSSKFAAAVSSIKLQNDNENAAHVRNGKVLWRSPETVVSRTASRVDATLDPRHREW